MKWNWIIIASTLVLLTAALFFVIHLHDSSKEAAVSLFQEQQLLHAHHVAEMIELFFWGNYRKLEALVASTPFRGGGMEALKLQIQAYFKNRDKDSVREISIHDGAGTTIYSTDGGDIGETISQSDLFFWAKKAENKGKLFVAPLIQGAPDHGLGTTIDPAGSPEPLQFLLAIPLYDGRIDGTEIKPREEFAGVLSLAVDLKTFVAIELNDFGMILHEVWIIENSGRVLFHSSHPEMTFRNVFQRDESCNQCHVSFDYVHAILREKQGTLSYEATGPKKLAGFASVEFGNASWIVVVNAEDDRVTSFVNKSLRDHLMLLGIVFLSLAGSSVLITRNYQSRARAEEEARHLQEKIAERKKAEEALKESEHRLRFLSSQILTAQERERGRISRELHDELGQALATLKLRVGVIEMKAHPEQTELREECKEILEYLDQVIENVRRLSRDLSPAVLEYLGLSIALRRLLSDFAKNYNVKVTLDLMDIDPLFPLDAQTNIYRIFQEIVNNTGKHSQATSFTAAIVKQDGALFFTFEDNGKGFDLNGVAMRDAHRKGLGLDILDERVRMLGGVLDIWSQEGKGTRITIRIPNGQEGH